MLTDAELNQMLADAAEMQRLRDAASKAPWRNGKGAFTDGIVFDANDEGIAEFVGKADDSGARLSHANLKFTIAARSDKSAEHVERLVQVVRTLQDTIRRMVPHPTYRRLFNHPELLAEYLKLNGDNPIGIRRTIEACHIHGVEVPPHLKPYEEDANG